MRSARRLRTTYTPWRLTTCITTLRGSIRRSALLPRWKRESASMSGLSLKSWQWLMLGRRLQRDKIGARQSWQLASGFDSVRGGTDGLLNESILPQPLRYPILRYSPKGENRMSTHDRLAQGYAQSNERSGYFPTMQTAPEELPPIATVLAD